MLAHQQGSQLNLAQLGKSLDLSIPTVKRYVGLLEDLLLVSTLRPWFSNVGKRLVKTPPRFICATAAYCMPCWAFRCCMTCSATPAPEPVGEGSSLGISWRS